MGESPPPSRLRPEAALLPGTSDAWRLLILWYVRKSHYAVIAIGIIVLAVTRHLEDNVDVTENLPAQLFSPAAGVVLGLFLRFGTSFVALLMVYPLVRSYDADLPPRTGVTKPISLVLDRLNLARAFRSLRWSHHVRQAALARLGPAGQRVGLLDPLIDLVNVTTWVVAIIAVMVTID